MSAKQPLLLKSMNVGAGYQLKNLKQRAKLSVIWKKENANPVLKNCMDLLLARPSS